MPKGETFLLELFKRIRLYITRLERRQRILLSFLILTLLFSLYFNKLLKPKISQLRHLKLEWSQLNSEMLNLKMQMPSLDKERLLLREAEVRNKQLKARIMDLEKELPESYRIPQLLGELAKQAGGYNIDFLYIKPKSVSKPEEGQEYAHLDIEMQFNAPYYDFRDYLMRLERLSAFLNISDIVIEEIKDEGFVGGTTVTLLLSTLLSKETQRLVSRQPLLTEESAQKKEGVFLERIPFLPDSRRIKEYFKSTKYTLSGITFAGLNSTAIINNELYRIGDSLNEGWAIKQILPNMVIISRGRQTETLMLDLP